jgi:hypothetical protein
MKQIKHRQFSLKRGSVCLLNWFMTSEMLRLQGAREIILAELTKRVHQIFPDAEVKVKPMQANGLNSDASKSDREN